ncbi:TPA: hypothetical protein I8Y81_000293 [Legionella pneumophila]|nr:hypothetical protein [Legionella pneumophila]HBD9376127.1 hypothetical protein [Legionella pneumophila]
MSFFLTIFSSVIIFILSQFTLKLILEPVIELKKAIGMIGYTLLFFHSKLTNASENNEISNEIKICSSKLLATYSAIPFYSQINKILYLPPYKDLLEASRELNLIHAYMLEGNKESCKLEKPIHFPIEISKSMKKIGELLNIATSYEEKSNK